MTESDLMTIEQVADYLRLKPQTIYKWAQEGRIPAAKLGKEWRFRQSILENWVNTAIHLSDAGFDLMVNQAWLQMADHPIPEEAIGDLVEKRWDSLCD